METTDRNTAKQNSRARLEIWKRRLEESNTYFSGEVNKMDEREKLYNGQRTLRPLVPGDQKKDGGQKETSHVRNIIFENIESQISASIPAPKVTPRRKKDEHLAEMIEHFLRNELDRLPFETMNDMAERTVPIQGGTGFLTEWDNTRRTHMTVGEVAVNVIHPKQFAPQPGVYTNVEDMDWFIIKFPTTKEAVRREFGINVDTEGESEPEVRGTGEEDHSDDAVTKYIGYEMADGGGINQFIWVNDVVLCDLENYQARRQKVCCGCGRVRPLPGQVIHNTVRKPGNLLPDPALGTMGGLVPTEVAAEHILAEGIAARTMEQTGEGMFLAGLEMDTATEPETVYDGGACPWCGGSEFADEEQKYEQVMLPITTKSGLKIPGAVPGFDKAGNAVMKPTLIPFYKPDVYPIVVQKSVSVYGQFLGNSDVDVIRDQQNTINRLGQKIIDRLIKAGTRITLPNRTNLRTDPEDGERWFIDNPADKQMIDVYEFSGNLQYEMAYMAQVYEESRQELGITDSYQGRHDSTATSGKAKEFSAAQAAGRMESKRIMKNAAYAKLFEIMFKFWLAYSDEPRPVSFRNANGQTEYEEFNRYDFLEQDADGQYYWNDQFLFSCDTSAPLASNREAMWQETRMNLQTGAFGDPNSTETLILFWTKMEELHYPGAASTKKFLEQRLERERTAIQQQTLMQNALTQQQPMGQGGGGGIPVAGSPSPAANRII